MRSLLRLLAYLAVLVAVPAQADTVYDAVAARAEHGGVRFVSSAVSHAEATALARFGPFRVLDDRTVALVDVTDTASPAQFQAMLAAYPGLATLRFIESPGTFDDRANLKLGRMIRAAGLAIEVPADGSVRSGGVELVLAGTSRTIDDRAEFAVHAWQDETGRQATDYAADARANAKYLAYYREMGLPQDVATSFYAMTNSVPFERARWLTGAELRGWLGEPPAAPALTPVPQLALAVVPDYLSLQPALDADLESDLSLARNPRLTLDLGLLAFALGSEYTLARQLGLGATLDLEPALN